MTMTEQTIKGWRKGFWSLFATQFQESFSDNAYRWLMVTLITTTLAAERQNAFVFAVTTLFSLPFILFSMAGGYLADRFSKRSVLMGTKVAEMGVMGLVLLGLTIGNLPILLCALFMRSTQSAIFSPSKYGLLPELLPEDHLSWGNGIIELGTFAAIICGTVAGLMYTSLGNPAWSGAI